MAAFSTIIAGVGLALGAAGTAVQYAGQKKAQAGAARAERIREAQSTIENTRQQRSIVRQALQARAAATSNAATQGAALGSGLQGGLAQIQGTAGSASVASNQNQGLALNMFDANRTISAGQSQASLGSGLSSLGGGLVQNSETIGRVGNYAFGVRGT